MGMQCKDLSIIQLFTEYYTVPDYQRPYAWGLEQVNDFFDDLVSFSNSKLGSDDFYLFGQIIIHNNGDTNYIVDGQQRIATSTIFLCALRDYIKKYYHSEESTLTRLNSSIGFDDDEGFKLKMGKLNQEFFFEYIQCGNHEISPRSKFDKLIYTAYRTLYHRIYDLVESDSDALKRIVNAFTKQFHVSFVETDNERQAFIIFETLNSRGMPLNTQDLLKNRFFCYLGERYPHIKDKWAEMVISISEVDGDTEQFIRYYWNSCHEFTRNAGLFSAVSAINEISELKKTFDNIIELYPYYIELISPDRGKFSETSQDALHNLKVMNAKSYIPLILSLKLKKVNPEDEERILVAIESLIFRNQVVMKKTSNENEVFFGKLAKKFSDNVLTVQDIISQINKAMVSDEEMKAIFSNFKPEIRIARMILTNIYNMDHPEIKIKSSRAVHIEHIMPQTIGDWNIEENIWNEYKDRIGNMVLLDGKKNIAASNDTFDEKKPRYLLSDIDDTRNIANYESWDETNIINHQDYIFERICERWPKQ